MLEIETRYVQRIIDIGVLSLAFWAAFLFRFDGDIPYLFLKRALFLWPYVVILQYLSLALWDVPRFSWRYFGLREANRIFIALGLSSTFLLAMRLVGALFSKRMGSLQYIQIPIGVILIDFLLGFLAIVGVRASRRLLGEHREARKRTPRSSRIPTLLIGAGSAGLLAAKEIGLRPDLGMAPVGFVDDDRSKVGTALHGIPVRGTTAQLPRIVKDTRAEQAIITIANAPGQEIRRIAQECRRAGLPAKIIPGIYELISGRINLNRLRKVTIEDLLRRQVPDLDGEAIAALVAGKRVMVTGAGGFIGKEICRQVADLSPAELLLVERAEPNLFAIHHALGTDSPTIGAIPLLCDVCDRDRMRAVFTAHPPDIVFHTAAYKHSPMMEQNPGESIKNNLWGTRIVAEQAQAGGVDTFVHISTDMALIPTSVLGATKRIAEIYLQSLATECRTRYLSVRFGEMPGSTGSLISLFQTQIARGGPVVVAHPEMARCFMTIPEITKLILQAATQASTGEVLLLEMGQPVKIVDLVRDLIRFTGLEPDVDIEIAFASAHPERQRGAGEREVGMAGPTARHTDRSWFEEAGLDIGALVDIGVLEKTPHPHIYRTRAGKPRPDQVLEALDRLGERLGERDPEPVRADLLSTAEELEVHLGL